ncbi:MAG TPA: bifunctional class I SAM-dependent methyltransferase/glycosyltransferase family 2 protein, partial [Actinomycetota bacterium]|nr:bifunctional class I SAM-dependent methyltransferase/glycosyltransferase family 2 protein [Actinomycetota bacterium]
MSTDDLRALDAEARRRVRAHFARVHAAAVSPRERYRTYYDDLYGFVRSQVPPGARVLDLGCGDGALLASLQPSYGVGVDASLEAIRQARRRFPDLRFVCADVERLPIDEPFDHVIASNLVGYLIDVQGFLEGLRWVAHPSTRLLLIYYNFLWEPVLKLAEAMGLKTPQPLQSWLSLGNLGNLLELAGFGVITSGHRTPLPAGPEPISAPVNRLVSALPWVNRLGLISYVTARPLSTFRPPRVPDPSCTVVIPARNERGNVRAAIQRLPQLGSHTEMIFVEGHSTDGTAEEIRAAIADHPERDVKLLIQDGSGKGDAVRKGFAAATGDVLMILDADLTVPPEELTKFWEAIVSEKGEFINGTRLVYPLEGEAMRLANLAGNKLFSLIFTWILGERVTDTLCGTKVLWASDYHRISRNRAVFGDFDPFGDFDLLFGAAKLGLKIREVPVRYRP